MSIFKEFLDGVARGEPRLDLFLVPNNQAKTTALLDLFNEAAALNLCPVIRHATNEVLFFNNAVAAVKIAHEHTHRELRGLIWTGVHGLDTLDKYENANRMKAELLSRVR